MADSKEKLFSEFPNVSTEDWMSKITVDLKGADYEKKLVWRTNEGFKVKPFYRQEDLKGLKTVGSLPGEFPYLRGNKKDDNTWLIRQEINVVSAKESNAKAKDILNKGIDSLGFSVKKKDISQEYVSELLDGIDAEKVELNFSTCQGHTVQLAKELVTYFTNKGYNLENIKGSVNYDPMGKMMLKGKDLSNFVNIAKELIETLAPMKKFRCICVNTVELNNSGAYIYQELGYALAWGNEYLEKLTQAGLPASLVAKKIKFNFGISSNYFLEIAKFRAARMLWADIVREYNPTCNGNCPNRGEDGTCNCSSKMLVHAQTSTFNMTLFDSYVNLLRTQTESMSAALAGVNSITVVPFDIAYKEADDFSERIARNQQLLLKEESHFNKVVDPAAGSYYIENLTVSIAAEAWKLFLDVVEKGGMLSEIMTGNIQDAINASNKARHDAVSKRKEVLLGTNQYPNFNELSEGKEPAERASCCGGEKKDSCDRPVKTLDNARMASEFEALRLSTEKSGKRPKAFMLTIGNLAMRQARAQFSCNFLACAGYEVIDNLGFQSVEEGVEEALKAKADIVVLCSSDDEYAEYAVPALKALDNRAIFIVAGAPACMDDLKAAGIENFIHVRCNVLDTLKEYNEKLGIKE